MKKTLWIALAGLCLGFWTLHHDAPNPKHFPVGTPANPPRQAPAETGASAGHAIAGSQSSESKGSAGLLPSGAMSRELQEEERASFYEVVQAARHAVTSLLPEEARLPQNLGVHYFAANPGQNLTARFLETGVRLESGRPDRQWRAQFGIHSPTRVRPSQSASSRVEYASPEGVVEWYQNRPEGIEHGFVLPSRPRPPAPENTADRECGLEIPITGDLRPVADPDSVGDILLVDKNSVPVLGYRQLKVWDATGRPLPSRMRPSAAGVLLAINDAQAVYPVTIDPLIVNLEQKLKPQIGTADSHLLTGAKLGTSISISGETAVVGGVGERSVYVFVRSGGVWTFEARLKPGTNTDDQFGQSVSISGETVLVGAYLDDLSTGSNAGSAYVFMRNAGVWNQQAKLVPGDSAASDTFGVSVSLEGDTALIGSRLDDDRGSNSGSAYIFKRTGTVWSQAAKLTATDGQSGDEFGVRVCLSGASALIGATYDDDRGSDAGSAYVFTGSGASWTFQQKLTAADGVAGDNFASALCLSGDAAVIGASGDDDRGSNSGSAYLFTRSAGTWSQQQKVTASNGSAGSYFGGAVGLDGDHAVIGAHLANTVYVFQRSGANWTEQTRLTAGAGDGYFGVSVAIAGSTIVGGAFDEDGPNNASGAAYAFVRNAGTWGFQAQMPVDDAAQEDRFGQALAIDGDTILVGAASDNTPAGAGAGSAYLFVRSGTTWTQQARLRPADAAKEDFFGSSVSLSGQSVLVSARGDDDRGDGSGSAYVFVRSGSTWSQQAKLTAADGASNDDFGYSVSLDGDTALVGALYADGVYVFVRTGAVWTQQTKLTAADGSNGQFFGEAVSLQADTAVIGASRDNEKGSSAGAAYVFTRSGTAWSQQAKLAAADASQGVQFGNAVSLRSDTLVVGAFGAQNAAGSSTGAAYVFVRQGTLWTQQAKLLATDGHAGAWFGHSVSLSGERVVVGARYDNERGFEAGAAYVFVRTGTFWTPQPKITPADAGSGDFFGVAVGLSGQTLVIGASGDDTPLPDGRPVKDQGSAYVYLLTPVPGPEIVLQQSSGPQLFDDQSTVVFSAAVGSSQSLSFLLHNVGDASLSGISASLSGPGASAFSLVTPPPAAAAAGTSTPFGIRFQPTAAGILNATLTLVSNDADENPFTIQLRGGFFVDLPLALDAEGFVFTTKTGTGWYGQTDVATIGGDAARSGPIDQYESSDLSTTVTGAGTLSFWWKVSSVQFFDELRLFVDGSLRTLISGNVDWQQRTLQITEPGSHEVLWRYKRQSSTPAGSDCGWVDGFTWTGQSSPMTDWATAAGLTGNEALPLATPQRRWRAQPPEIRLQPEWGGGGQPHPDIRDRHRRAAGDCRAGPDGGTCAAGGIPAPHRQRTDLHAEEKSRFECGFVAAARGYAHRHPNRRRLGAGGLPGPGHRRQVVCPGGSRAAVGPGFPTGGGSLLPFINIDVPILQPAKFLTAISFYDAIYLLPCAYFRMLAVWLGALPRGVRCKFAGFAERSRGEDPHRDPAGPECGVGEWFGGGRSPGRFFRRDQCRCR